MEQVEVEEYEVFANPDRNEIRVLINDNYLVVVKDEEVQAFANSVTIDADILTMPAQLMIPQQYPLSAFEDGDEDTQWHLNYFIEDDDLSKFYDGEVAVTEFTLPNHLDATELLDELTSTSK